MDVFQPQFVVQRAVFHVQQQIPAAARGSPSPPRKEPLPLTLTVPTYFSCRSAGRIASGIASTNSRSTFKRSAITLRQRDFPALVRARVWPLPASSTRALSRTALILCSWNWPLAVGQAPGHVLQGQGQPGGIHVDGAARHVLRGGPFLAAQVQRASGWCANCGAWSARTWSTAPRGRKLSHNRWMPPLNWPRAIRRESSSGTSQHLKFSTRSPPGPPSAAGVQPPSQVR